MAEHVCVGHVFGRGLLLLFGLVVVVVVALGGGSGVVAVVPNAAKELVDLVARGLAAFVVFWSG